LSPSASAAKASAFAAESILASLRLMTGKSSAPMATKATPTRVRRLGAIHATGDAARSHP
jgi:hypothetical protein